MPVHIRMHVHVRVHANMHVLVRCVSLLPDVRVLWPRIWHCSFEMHFRHGTVTDIEFDKYTKNDTEIVADTNEFAPANHLKEW